MAANNTEDRGLLSILSGDKAFQFSISIDPLSVTYLIGGGLVMGILLILISKKLIK